MTMRKLIKKIATIPHLFGKVIVFWCIAVGTGASLYALRILSRTGHDATALLGVILAFFGGELMVLCLRTILDEKKRDKVSKLDTERNKHEE